MIRGLQWNNFSSLMNEAIKKRSTDVNLQKLTSFQDDRGRHFDFTTVPLKGVNKRMNRGAILIYLCVCVCVLK